jgi:hypothetical protein
VRQVLAQRDAEVEPLKLEQLPEALEHRQIEFLESIERHGVTTALACRNAGIDYIWLPKKLADSRLVQSAGVAQEVGQVLWSRVNLTAGRLTQLGAGAERAAAAYDFVIKDELHASLRVHIEGTNRLFSNDNDDGALIRFSPFPRRLNLVQCRDEHS